MTSGYTHEQDRKDSDSEARVTKPGSARVRRDRMPGGEGGLIQGNVWVEGTRTSIRLERAMWSALEDIAGRHGTSPSELCTLVERQRLREQPGASLAARVRTFMVDYYRRAATPAGLEEATHWLEATYGKPRPAPLKGRPGRRRKSPVMAA